MRPDEPKVDRFSVAERVTHWLVALSFLYAALTGLALWSPRLYWLAAVFGGGPTVRGWHPWGGVAFAAFFAFMFRAWNRQMRLDSDDRLWLRLAHRYAVHDETGLPERPGVGHLHVMLDGMSMAQLTNFYCAQNFWISGQGVVPGQHTLTIDLATNDHADMEETAGSVTFLYQPRTPPAALPAPRSYQGATVDITAPANGATVGPQFDLQVQATNFTPSCELEGKRNVAGYGHFHVFVDEDLAMPMDMSMAMMNMPGMISMPYRSTA